MNGILESSKTVQLNGQSSSVLQPKRTTTSKKKPSNLTLAFLTKANYSGNASKNWNKRKPLSVQQRRRKHGHAKLIKKSRKFVSKSLI